VATPPPSEEPLVSFDGTFYGWRFASLDVLIEAGLAGGDPRDCDAQQYGAAHATDLDFGVAYLPSGPRTEEVTKSACGDSAWFVSRQIFFEETGVLLTMHRGRRATASLPLEVPASYVQSCEIVGLPSVCVHYRNDATGRHGHPAAIIVIEHQELDPFGVYFLLSGEEIPFAELVKVASSVSFD
jgi:hypothetical protein